MFLFFDFLSLCNKDFYLWELYKQFHDSYLNYFQVYVSQALKLKLC